MEIDQTINNANGRLADSKSVFLLGKEQMTTPCQPKAEREQNSSNPNPGTATGNDIIAYYACGKVSIRLKSETQT